MEFEDVLKEVGDTGRFQRQLLLLYLVPSTIVLPWYSFNILFMVSVPDHWCRVPELENSNLTLAHQKLLSRVPTGTGYQKCQTFAVNYSDVLSSISEWGENWTDILSNEQKSWPKESCQNGYQYDKTYYEATVTSKWDLVCENSHYQSLVLTLGNVGSIVGTPIFGALSDKTGRRMTFFITVIVTLLSGLICVFVNSFTTFLILRLINGSLMPSVFQLPYIILIELVGPSVRTRLNGIANSCWTLGLCLLPLIAYWCRHWMILGATTAAVPLFFFLYWRFLPESPRWLISQERYEEAAKIMIRIAKVNEKGDFALSDMTSKLQKMGQAMKLESSSSNDVSPAVFIQYPQLRKKFLIISLCWIANIAAYYGLHINASNLDGNQFLNFFILSIIEFPGYAASWLFMDKFGRRWCGVGSLLFIGFVCFVPVVIPPELKIISVACSLLGKFGSAAAFMVVYQQAGELFPTPVRSIGMGLCGTVAGISTVGLPYVIYLSKYGKYIPFLIISGVCICAGIFAAYLPETINRNLPQTLQDAEKFGRNQKFFSCNVDADSDEPDEETVEDEKPQLVVMYVSNV